MSWELSDLVCIDVETTGVNWLEDKIFGVAIAWVENGQIKSEYFDIRREPGKYKKLLSTEFKKVVNHNMKFDLHMLKNDGVLLEPEQCEDTMIRAALINEHLHSYSLDSLAKKYLGKNKVDDIYEKLAALFGGRVTRNAQMPNLHRAPPSLVEPYAKVDAEIALELYLWQEKEIERQQLHDVWNLERELFPHVFRMERHGIRIDHDKAEIQMSSLTSTIDLNQKRLNEVAGFEVNPNPSGSIMKLFEPKQNKSGVWVACDGTILPTTPAGKPSIGADVLRSMKHPAAALILKVRKMMKTRDTFIGGHILGHEKNGRVHPNINQTKSDGMGGTGTGRLSYTRPALQQIPSRDKDVASVVRPIFLPDEDMGWTYGDLDQHELRIFHHYVNNGNIVSAYAKNPDLDGHAAIAELTGLPRNAPQSGGANAKQMNLGMVFNMGGGELAAQMGLPYTVEEVELGGELREIKKAGKEAQAIIDQYYSMVPGVKEIAQKARAIAKSRGYVKTLMGRHIRFPGGQFTHKASGLVYQGTAGDLNKSNIIRISKYLASECPDAKLLLNIHDEYSISIPFGGAEKHMKEIKALVQNRPEIRVPLRIDFSEPSSNWWDATLAPTIT
jgi:DNA polymerase I-like protein with 3'-5' exonuclease and polymerase domains